MEGRYLPRLVLFFLLSLLAAPALAAGEFCASRTAPPTNQCFNSFSEAERFIKAEVSPTNGSRYLEPTKVTQLSPGRFWLQYTVKPRAYERFLGTRYGGTPVTSGGASGIACRSATVVDPYTKNICESEDEFARLLFTIYPYGGDPALWRPEYEGSYKDNPPVSWSTGTRIFNANLNNQPEAQRRKIYAVYVKTGVRYANSIDRSDQYQCPESLYSSAGPGFRWPEVCVNSTTGSITYTSKQVKGPCDGNPCMPASGNKAYREVDFEWEGISFARSYNSMRDMFLQSGMGDNWAHPFSDRLLLKPGGWADVHWIRSDGLYEMLTPGSENGPYRSRNESGTVLYREPEGTLPARWRLVSGDRVLWFNEDARLARIETGGKKFDLRYCSNADYAARVCALAGALTEVVSQSGRRLKFKMVEQAILTDETTGTEGAAAFISEISAENSPLVSYQYDTRGRLVHSNGGSGSGAGKDYLYAEAANLCRDWSGNVQPNCVASDYPFHLTGVVNELGVRSANYVYDAKGKVVLSEHAGGVGRVTLDYRANGDVNVVLPKGANKLYQFSTDVFPKPLSIKKLTTDGSVAPVESRIYQDMRVTSETLANGYKRTFAYDTFHETSRKEGLSSTGAVTPFTRTLQTDWHATLGKPVEYRTYDAANALVRKQTLTYNERGQVLVASTVDPQTNQVRSTTTSYCEQSDIAAPGSNCPVIGLVKSVDGPRTDVNDVTTYKYYAADEASCATSPSTCLYRKGDPWTVTNAAGQIVSEYLRYDLAGRVLSSLDANGVVTDYEYNARGWLTATKVRGTNDATEVDDRITRMEYWPTGPVKKVTLPDGAITNYGYDADSRLTDISDDAGNTIHYTLDADGNREKEDTKTASGTLKRTLSRVYNQLSQLAVTKDASGNPTTFAYDAEGNADRITDALGRITDHDYDPLNRLSRTLQDVGGLNVETKFAYDASDRLIKVTDPKGLNTVYDYNGFGDQTRLTSPDTGITNYTYNAAGLVATKQDANDPEPHRYTYDALNRPKTVSYIATGAPVEEYDYDIVNSVCAAGETFAIGRVSAMRTDGTELKYCYDRLGQVVRKVQTVDSKSLTVRYAYTLGGQLRSMTYPDGAMVDYVRDSQARVKEVGVAPASGLRTVLLTGATYEPFGPPVGWAYGSGRTLARTYDLDYRPKSVFDPASGGLSLGFNYSAVGELIKLENGPQDTAQAGYEYDALGRLKITRDGLSGEPLETYGYDAIGNRTSVLHGAITDIYDYSMDSHRLNRIGAIERSYDAVGNTTSIGGTAKEFIYDASDRIRRVKLGGTVNVGYRYNVIGERVAAINGDVGPVTAYTIYDEEGNWAGSYDQAGRAMQQAIWMDDMPVGLLVGAGASQSLKYVQSDHLATPRSVIDPVRNVAIWSWDAKSEAFGSSPPNQDPDLDGNSFVFDLRFPGQLFDSIAGMNYNYYRDYDASAGRYLQSDPIGLSGGLSTYSYVNNSPLVWFDRDGLAAATITGNEVSYAAGVSQVIRAGGLLNSISAAGGGAAVRGAAACASCVAAGVGGLLVGYATYNGFSNEIADGIDYIGQLMVAEGNQVDTGIANDYGAAVSAAKLANCPPPKRCEWLEANASKYSAARVKKTAKAWGCKGSRHNKAGKAR